MSTLSSLKKKRGSVKAKLTNFGKFVNNFAKLEEINREDVLELKERLLRIENWLDDYDTVQAEIEAMHDDPQEEYQNREKLESTYFKAIVQAKRLINAQEPESDGSDKESIRSLSERSHDRSLNEIGVRLPKIELPKFDGNYSNWLEYRDSFKSLIHDQKAVSEIQKFHYLRASLQGEALKVIGSLEFTSVNYAVAWEAILERYNNDKILINSHVRAIFNLEAIAKESAGALRKIVDEVSKNLRCLEQLNQPTENWDTLIIFLINTKLDMTTLREWEDHSKNIESPKLDDIKSFLSARATLLETLQITESERKGSKPQKSTRGLLVTESQSKTREISCDFCQQAHYIQNCGQFLKLNINERVDKIKELKLCLNCLRAGHTSKICKRGCCKRCSLKHNTLLHYERKMENSSTTTDNSKAATSKAPEGGLTLVSRLEDNYIFLSTALVHIVDKYGKLVTVRALLDSGSQASYITKNLCDKLQLKSIKENISICGLNGMSSKIAERCEVKMNSLSNNFSTKISCLVIPFITGSLPSTDLRSHEFNFPKNIKLADPLFYMPQPIDMLIGADLFWTLLCIGQISMGKSGPMLQKTRLGWIIAGPLQVALKGQKVACNLATVDIESQLARFWELEEVTKEKVLTEEERACEDHFTANVKRKEDGRFVVKIPFKQQTEFLGDSLKAAQRRFLKLETKLESNRHLKNNYIEFMQEYERLGHMNKVRKVDTNGLCYYMPHHCVIREDSVTTKLRVVFDASATTSSGWSLNSLQMTGPTLQNNLISILIRFRQHAYVVTADIEKMYRQIEVNPEDRKFQRILWRESANDELSTYELNTVTYGTTSASFLAVRALFQLAEENHERKLECEVIKNDFYMDDMLSGADTIEKASQIAQGVHGILKQGCFNLRKFCSNNENVLNSLKTLEEGEHGILKLGRHENAKTLGLIWNPGSDTLGYDISNSNVSSKVTKRTILSEISQIFDPLGLLSPCIIIAKIILQHLWIQKLTWDEALPLQLHETWANLRRELPVLNELKIERFALCEEYQSIELHAFSDASERAYGACVYFRVISHNLSKTILLCAKTKVAPVKSISLPRLELAGALISARLVDVVTTSLRLKIDSKTFWTDSTIVLGWLKVEPNQLKTFVSNRVSEIQQLSKGCQWRHVPGSDNPADILSRGTMPKDIARNQTWWEGPKWLKLEPEQWPTMKNPTLKDLPESKSKLNTLLLSKKETCLFDFNRFSKLSRLKSTAAYVLRFIRNSKCNQGQKFSPPNAIELDKAMNLLIKKAQGESFFEDIERLKQKGVVGGSSKLWNLNPYLDDEEILRVGGRIENSKHPVEKKHPIILDARHRFTVLIFTHEHERLLHVGPQQLLAAVREIYWPIGARILAKRIFRMCVKCHRANPRIMSVTPGQLPESRLAADSVFKVVGVDYAGPIMTKNRRGRGAKLVKSYIALFICFSTKAVHIEAVSDLSSESFLMCLRRFVSRRGIPKKIYSDNGRNFVAAAKELSSFLQDNSQKIEDECSKTGIEWSFIPPFSPHFGGLWEAGVKCAKTHLKRVTGEAHLTFEELSTLLVQIEAILNSRPILPMSDHPDDFLPLTPGHFLIGKPLTAIPDADHRDIPMNRLTRFQHIQQCQQHFWQRWHKEYLTELQRTYKKKHGLLDLKEQQLVLIKGEGNFPTKWRLGRIVKLFPGRDGVSRVALIKTANGDIKRSFAKLSPLPTIEL